MYRIQFWPPPMWVRVGNKPSHRLSANLGIATQPCLVDTVKTVGRHFRLPGHDPHSDLMMMWIEKISDKESKRVFLCKPF